MGGSPQDSPAPAPLAGAELGQAAPAAAAAAAVAAAPLQNQLSSGDEALRLLSQEQRAAPAREKLGGGLERQRGDAGWSGAGEGEAAPADGSYEAGDEEGRHHQHRRRPSTRAQPKVELPPKEDDGPPGYANWIGRGPSAPPPPISCPAEYSAAAGRYRTLHSLYRRLHDKIEESITVVHGAAEELRKAPPFGSEGPQAEAALRALLERERPVVARWDSAFKSLHSELRALKMALREYTAAAAAAAGAGAGDAAEGSQGT